MNHLLTGPGTVYIGATQETPRVEFAGKDWKVVGYAKNIELKNERDYEDISTDWGYPTYKTLTGERYTVTFELANVDDRLYTLFTGQALEPQPKATVEQVKDVLRGQSKIT